MLFGEREGRREGGGQEGGKEGEREGEREGRSRERKMHEGRGMIEGSYRWLGGYGEWRRRRTKIGRERQGCVLGSGSEEVVRG